MTIPVENVPEAAARLLPSPLEKYLPSATWMFGSCWTSLSPRANAKRQYVHLNDLRIEKSGCFHDQCTGARGDAVELMAYLWKCTRTRATDRLAGMISPGAMLLDQLVSPSAKVSTPQQRPNEAKDYRGAEKALDQLEALANGGIRAEALRKLRTLDRR